MATPWPQVLVQVPSLNDPQAPFSYSVTADGVIVGFWDVAKIQMLGIAGATSFDKEYRIDVRPSGSGDGELAVDEHHTQSSGSVGASGGSFRKEFFAGKSTQKSFGFQAGLGGSSRGEPTNSASWAFDTAQIKDPLFGFLRQHGWEQKKGFFGRLFG